ncbi:MAG: hypothetical protein Q9211_000789 [Gyalolechia sp. 1 TL-2023]
MTLRDLLKKREKVKEDAVEDGGPPASQFTFVRSDTNTQEVISPPSFADEYEPHQTTDTQPRPKRLSRFRTSSNASTASNTSTRGEKRLSHRLHLGSHSRSSSISSTNVPSDLPPISDEVTESEEKEAQWENRATILAQENPAAKQGRSRENSAAGSSGRPPIGRGISDATGDVRDSTFLLRRGGYSDDEGQENIQEAIRLHEAGGTHIHQTNMRATRPES